MILLGIRMICMDFFVSKHIFGQLRPNYKGFKNKLFNLFYPFTLKSAINRDRLKIFAAKRLHINLENIIRFFFDTILCVIRCYIVIIKQGASYILVST